MTRSRVSSKDRCRQDLSQDELHIFRGGISHTHFRGEALGDNRLNEAAENEMNQGEDQRRDAHERGNREDEATDQKARQTHSIPSRVISLVRPWRVTPSSVAARAR